MLRLLWCLGFRAVYRSTSAHAGAARGLAMTLPTVLKVPARNVTTSASTASAEHTTAILTERTAPALLTNVFSEDTDASRNAAKAILIAAA